MNKTVKRTGGILTRVIATLNDFRAKHGYWPESLEIQASSISALVTYYLTPLGFFLVQSKVELKEGREGDIVARGRGSDIYSYSEEMGDFKSHSNHAELWLGLDLDLDH